MFDINKIVEDFARKINDKKYKEIDDLVLGFHFETGLPFSKMEVVTQITADGACIYVRKLEVKGE